MKKTLLLIGIFLVTLTTYSQNNQIEFGIKAGLNYASFIDNNDDDISADYKAKIGFHLGGFVIFGISKKISIRPELLYSQQGSDFSINGSELTFFNPNDPVFIASVDGKIKESLLLIPIMTVYHFNEKISLALGPQFGYSLNREIEFENNSFGIELIRNDDDEKFEFGIGLGLGYSFSNDFGISLRYNYGIIERQNLNTSVVQLAINYKL